VIWQAWLGVAGAVVCLMALLLWSLARMAAWVERSEYRAMIEHSLGLEEPEAPAAPDAHEGNACPPGACCWCLGGDCRLCDE